ncbi:MAG: hypothetical protein N2114_03125 [Candidatus Goldbacteria bacterium]|nr:hypothetical protein [Candidatus Goldiibacteriota bacterium]
MRAIIVIFILSIFLFSCATTGKQKTEIRTDQFQNILGFVVTGAGLASGAYLGYQAADKQNYGQSFSYGLMGGIFGGLVSGGVYYLAMQLVAERVEVEVPEKAEELKADETILFPK